MSYLFNVVPISQKGVANGVATLDSAGDIPSGQLNNIPLGFDAIVDSSGTADFTTLGAAISAGKRNIYILNGSYTESATIELVNNLRVLGESPDGVIIDWNTNAPFEYYGTADSSGTVILSVGDTSVDIPGISDVYIGNIITLKGYCFLITDIISDTIYFQPAIPEGVDGTSLVVLFADPVKNVNLKNITIKSTGYSGLEVEGAMYFSLENIYTSESEKTISRLLDMYSGAYGLKIKNCRGGISAVEITSFEIDGIHSASQEDYIIRLNNSLHGTVSNTSGIMSDNISFSNTHHMVCENINIGYITIYIM